MIEIETPNILGIEFWSGCNLRCTYCPVSDPGHKADEMGADMLDRLYDYVYAHPPQILFLQCGGELTSLKDWVGKTQRFMDLQMPHPTMQLGITSNLQKRLAPEEVAAIARFNYFLVSIDAADEDLQRAIRPPAELRNAVMNIAKIRTHCLAAGTEPPIFRMNCVVSDRNARQLDRVFAFAAALGFKEVYLLDVDETVPHGADGPRGLRHMDDETFLAVLQHIQAGVPKLAANGITFTPAKNFWHTLMLRANGQAADHRFGPGETKVCLEPWTYAGFLANGTVAYCCGGIQDSGIDPAWPIDRQVNCETVRAVRDGLLAGGAAVPERCRTCAFAEKGHVRTLAGQVADLPHIRPDSDRQARSMTFPWTIMPDSAIPSYPDLRTERFRELVPASLFTMPRSGTWYLFYFFEFLDALVSGRPWIKTIHGFEDYPSLGFFKLHMHGIYPGFESAGHPDFVEKWRGMNRDDPAIDASRGTIQQYQDVFCPHLNERARVIYVYRNPLDQIVSAFHHKARHRVELGIDRDRYQTAQVAYLNEYARTEGIDLFLAQFMTFDHMRQRAGEHLLMIRYEDLMADPATMFRRMLAFLGADMDSPERQAAIARALEITSRDQMREFERMRGRSLAGDRGEAGQSHIQSGASGRWQDVVSADTIAAIRARMAEFGLDLDSFLAIPQAE
ncbi:sulfotransferase domain-containing protein [Magnetospirillum sp. UT-4]|uniref:sulfotransferase domain-containing protein n=1 Tax=Magnetospirillum sp. UT-4 TaxID=2681467 RepID=UPI001384E1F0|nr:sulfotransferase domain-containing protein [Magnetospirillum sp. UT-4]CAA7618467.1 hypothetical protein MTBUT4_30069 [Magnetospirillum sp. UT-4]